MILSAFALNLFSEELPYVYAQASFESSGYVTWVKVDPQLCQENMQRSLQDSALSAQLHAEAEMLRKQITAREMLMSLSFWSNEARRNFFGEVAIPAEDQIQEKLSSEEVLDLRIKALLLHTRAMQQIFPERYDRSVSLGDLENRREFFRMLKSDPDRMKSFMGFSSEYLALILDESKRQAKEWIERSPEQTKSEIRALQRELQAFEKEREWFLSYLENPDRYSPEVFSAELNANLDRVVFLALLRSQNERLWGDEDRKEVIQTFTSESIYSLPPEEIKILEFQSYSSALEDFEKVYASDQWREIVADPTNIPFWESNLAVSAGMLAYWGIGRSFTKGLRPRPMPSFSKSQWMNSLTQRIPPGLSRSELDRLLTSEKTGRALNKVKNLPHADPAFVSDFERARADLDQQKKLKERLLKKTKGRVSSDQILTDKLHQPNGRAYFDSKASRCRESLSTFQPDSVARISKTDSKDFARSTFPSWHRFFLRRQIAGMLQNLSIHSPRLNLLEKIFLGSVDAMPKAFALSLLPTAFEAGRLLIFGPSEPAPESWEKTNFEDPLWSKALEDRMNSDELRSAATEGLLSTLRERLISLNGLRIENGQTELKMISGPEGLVIDENVRVPGTESLLISGRVGQFMVALVPKREAGASQLERREDLENSLLLSFVMTFENESAETIEDAGEVVWVLDRALDLSKASNRDRSFIVQAFSSKGKILSDETQSLFSRSNLVFFSREE